MFGNLINNIQIKKLITDNEIDIEKFNQKNLGLVHYTLHIGRIKERQANGDWIATYDFNENSNPFMIPANEYVIVEVKEKIKLLNDNIVGEFCPASNLIESGFGLTSGKIDKKYGTTGEKQGCGQERVVFGLKNYLNTPNEITKDMRVAHVSFYDLRGVSSTKSELSKTEINRRLKRLLRDYNDGVDYELDI